jgi:hypothetical protein
MLSSNGFQATTSSEIHRILFSGGVLIVAFIERGKQIYLKYLHEGGKGRFLSHARFYSKE